MRRCCNDHFAEPLQLVRKAIHQGGFSSTPDDCYNARTNIQQFRDSICYVCKNGLHIILVILL